MATNGPDDIAAAIKLIPVSWLHQPRIILSAKESAPEPKIAPLAAAAIGVAAGAGIQLAGQALRKTGPDEQKTLVQGVECHLPIEEIERIARRVMEDSGGAKSGGLHAIAEPAAEKGPGAKPFPIATAAFLAGVAAGASAARR
jgi:hypothetical protein